MRSDGRAADELRPVKVRRRFTRTAPGSVLIRAGRTTVLCTVSPVDGVPPWLQGTGQGWLTAEYGMLPGSTHPRRSRDRGRVDGRTVEIQRLIGRSLRSVTRLDRLGELTLWVDCDVLEADGGTRTLSITGAFIALVDALKHILPRGTRPADVLIDSVAAVSVGIVNGTCLLDLNYQEDSQATVDFNLVLTGTGRFVELQGTGETAPFYQKDLTEILRLARQGIEQLTAVQRAALGKDWPFGSD